MAYALVINSGSSSIKFQVVDPESSASDDPFVSGLVEQIGEPQGRITIKHNGQKYVVQRAIPNHKVGLEESFGLLEKKGIGPTQIDIRAVGHRVVHGGMVFSQPELIVDQVVEMIRDLIPLAPLHNPANIDGIEVARELLPDIPHVAVFDTGFFRNLPPAAALYAINAEIAEKNQIRRYGFHGTSHEFVSEQVPALIERDPLHTRQIVLHLGNGASCSAVENGHAIDTSMGLTPLAGLVMGTRSGDIDPGIIFHLARSGGMTVDQADKLLNRESGLKGMAGVNDFRELKTLIEDGDENAQLAYDVYIHALRRFIGSYMLILGGVDAIVFTAGVGENAAQVRRDAMADLQNFGIEIDEARNENSEGIVGAREISTDDSTVKVFVVPTNEELAIARQATELAEQQ